MLSNGDVRELRKWRKKSKESKAPDAKPVSMLESDVRSLSEPDEIFDEKYSTSFSYDQFQPLPTP